MMNGKIGLDVGYSASLGSTSASYPDVALNQDYVAPTAFGQDVSLSTSLAYSSGSFSTTSLEADAYANLVADINGSLAGKIEAFGVGTTYNQPFGGSLNDQPLFYIGIGSGAGNELGVTLTILGADLSDQLNDFVSSKSLTDVDVPIFETPPVSIAGDLSASTSPIGITQGFSLEEGESGAKVTGSLDLGSLSAYDPDIELSSSDLLPNGALSDAEQGELADLSLQMGALAATALGSSLGLPQLGALAGTETIKFGSASLSFTPVSFEMGPVLYLEQIGSITPTSTLTYNFSSPVVLLLDGHVQNGGSPESAVTFTPGVDTVSIQDPGTDPITVRPTWNFGMNYHTELDLNLDLEGTLTVGQVTASLDHVGSLTLGPLYQDTFDFANSTLGTIWSDSASLGTETYDLPSFTIAALPTDLHVTTNQDYGMPGSLTYAVHSASEYNSAIIELGDMTYTWDPAGSPWASGTGPATLDVNTSLTIYGAGAGQTIIDASVLANEIFDVEPGASLTLEGITLENGQAVAGAVTFGGGVYNAGTLTVSDSTFSGDTSSADVANPGGGGAIYNDGTLTVSDSTFSGDTSNGNLNYGGGGAIYNDGTLTVSDSTFSGDTSYSDLEYGGGAIYNNGTLTISDSSFSGDTAFTNGTFAGGGAIYSNGDGVITIDNSVLTNDTAQGGAGFAQPSGNGGAGGYGYGGAIYYFDPVSLIGLLDVEDSTLSNDQAIGGTGGTGGSYSSGLLTAGAGGGGGNGDGGGVYVVSANLLMFINDTFSGDDALGGTGGTGGKGGNNGEGGGPGGPGGPGGTGVGGGLFLQNAGQQVLLSSDTFNSDGAQGGTGGTGGHGGTGDTGGTGGRGGTGGSGNNGGGIYVIQSEAYLLNDTLSGNSAQGGAGGAGGAAGSSSYTGGSPGKKGAGGGSGSNSSGGGLDASDGIVELGNTLIALNDATTSGPDIFGNINLTFTQNNLIGNGAGSNLSDGDASGDLVGFTASTLKLGPLANNGGPTQTMALLSGSPAIAAGTIYPIFYGLPLTDQRGLARTVYGHVDIGAVEYQFDLDLTGSVFQPSGSPDFEYFYTVTNNGPDSGAGATLTVPLPNGIAYLGHSSSSATESESDPGVGNSGTVVFKYALLIPGQSVIVTIRAALQNNANAAVGAILTSTAVVGPATSDDILQNNSLSLTVNTEQEGQRFQNVDLFHFIDPNATANDFTAAVNWGDHSSNMSNDGSGTVSVVADAEGGFDVLGSHTYVEEGDYSTTLTVTGMDGTQFSSDSQQMFVVADAPLTAGPLTPPPNATINQPNTSDLLFHFTDANPYATPSDFTATVTWGDGMTNTSGDGSGNVKVVADPDGGFDVDGSHTYNELLNPGTFQVQVNDSGGASTSASTTFYVLNADPPLSVVALYVPSVTTEGQSISNALLFQFSDPDTTAQISDYLATVYWGDGTNDTSDDGTGTVWLVAAGALGNGDLLFDVFGSHTFAAGSDYFGVEVTDLGDPGHDTGGQIIYAASAAPLTISDPPLVVTAGPTFTSIEGVTSSVQTVATFTDPGIPEQPDAVPNPYLATIEWGDGSITAATGLAQANYGQAQPATYGPVLSAPFVDPVDGNLAAGTYYYTVTSLLTSTVGTTTSLVESTPGNELSATTTGNLSAVMLTWSPVPDAAGYRVYRGTSLGGENTLIATITSGTTHSFFDSGAETTYPAALRALPESYVPQAVGATASGSGGALGAGTYYYTVTSTTATLESTTSDEVFATTTGSTSEVGLSWSQVPGATGYNVYRGTAPGDENVLVATIAGGTTHSFSDTGSESISAAPQEALIGHPLSSVSSESVPSFIVLGSDGQTYSVNLAHEYAQPGIFTITILLDHEGVLTPGVTTTATVFPTNPTVDVTDSGGPFNGSPYTASTTVDGAASAEGVSPTLQYFQLQGGAYVPISFVPVHVGSYEVTATFAPPVAGYTPVSNTTTFSITPVAFTYQIGTASQTYGTAVNLASALGTTISTGVNNETLAITYSSSGDSATADVQAGGYAITGAVSNGTGLTSDYSVTLNNGALTVSPYAFSYTIASDHQTYGTAANLATDLGTTIATGVNGQALDIAYASVGDTGLADVVGSPYPITGTLSSGTGLTSDFSVTLNNGALTVSPYAFSYTIASDHQTYGTAANLATDLGTTIATGVNGQALDIAYASVGDTGLAHMVDSPYPITGTLSSGTGLTSDFSVTLNNGALTVNPYAFTYAIANDDQIYGTPANLATDLGTTIATGVNGQALDVAYASVGDTDLAHVGSPYPITGTLSKGTGLTSDFSVTLNNGALTVDPAPLTITAANASMVAGQPIPSFNVQFSTLVLVQGPNVLSGALTITTAANAASRAGSYLIIPGGLSSPDYAITYVDGTLTVAAPLVTVTNVEWVKEKHRGSERSTRVLDVFFSGALNPTSAESVVAYKLDSRTRREKLGTHFTRRVPFKTAAYSSSADMVTLTPRRKVRRRKMELTIRGMLIQDAEGRRLAGNDDGQAGSNYVALLNRHGLIIAARPSVRTTAISAKAFDSLIMNTHLDLKGNTRLGSSHSSR
jgi:hypothetical protein